MSKVNEPNKGKNEQNNGNKTAIFNNHRQNIISYGNKYRQENNNNINNDNINNRKSYYNYRGRSDNNNNINFNIGSNKEDENKLNPQTQVKINKKNNLLGVSINVNLLPNDDDRINNISNNNNRNNIQVNNRRPNSYVKNNNNINNHNIENKINKYQFQNLYNDLNYINNNINVNNKNNLININNNDNNINNNKMNRFHYMNRSEKNIQINKDNNFNSQKNDNNQIQINIDKNRNSIKINPKTEKINKEIKINIDINKNSKNENINNDQNNQNINDNKDIINDKIEEKKGRSNLFKSVIDFNDEPKGLNNINKAKENKDKIKAKEELLKKKKQDENNKAEIKDKLKCYICMSQVKKPRACKYCNRPACQECLKLWLRTKNACGFCRKKIKFEETIEIPIINDIADFFIKAIDKEDNEKSKNIKENKDENKIFDSYTQIVSSSKLSDNDDECSKHKKKYEYYCFQCKEKYCDKCLSFLDNSAKIHENHMIVPLDQLDKNNSSNEVMNEFNKLQKTNEKLDDLINLCNQKLDELYIEKNNFIDQIDYIELGKKLDLDGLIYQISSKIDLIKSKVDECTNSIDTTPIALKNIINLKDYGQGKQIYDHIYNLNKLAQEEENIVDSIKDNIYIETFVSDNMEISIPDNKNKNNFQDNQPLINQPLDNLIPGVKMIIYFKYHSNDIIFKIKLKNNVDSNIDLTKILCFIIFKKRNNGIEFLKIKNQENKVNEIQLFSNISSSVFHSFVNDNNKIIYKFYFMVYK